MKKCFKCGIEKERTEFYTHPQMADGLLGKCKSCSKKDIAINREKKADYYNKKDRERAHIGYPRRAAYQKERKEIRIPHRILHEAIRNGSIIRLPCEKCGDVKSHGHHEDYSKPLEVSWLCQKHHRRRHAELVLLGIDVYKTIPKIEEKWVEY